MRKCRILFMLVPLLFVIIASAQVKTDFNNQSLISFKGRFVKEYKPVIDFEIAARSITELLDTERREQLQSSDVKPFRLATPVAVDLDIAKLISWNVDNDYAYGKYTIRLNGALSASINFDRFNLPNGTEMYVYNENGNMITGPVTEAENNENNIWGSWVYQGAYLIIEIKTPAATIKQLRLHSNNIAYGYKEVYKSIKTGGFGTSGACNVNVICPLGNGWEAERNSVATILSATGGEFCTGSMVMNTCRSNTPYFLTANHCFEGNTNVAGWRFNFQAWSATCPNPGTNASGVMFNGSALKARNAASDFCLVQLFTTPPNNSGIHYAGWTRSTTPATNATGIHHPRGDVMKISRANNPVSIASFGGSTNQHWQSTWSPQDNGSGVTVTPITEPGSSGSPLFDQDHRIIGQLHGGPSFCGSTQPWDFYGRFDQSWTGGGTSTTRLSNWLDPCNYGSTTTNTTTICQLSPVTIPMTNMGCSGEYQYWSLSATPANGTNWLWSVSYVGTNSYINIWSPTSSTTMVSVKGGGAVRLNYTDACGVARQDGVTVWSSCYSYPYYRVTVSPNPAKDKINVSLAPVEDGKVTADDMQTVPLASVKSKGRTVMSLYELYTKARVRQWTYNESKNQNYSLNISGLRPGVYVLQIDRDNQTKVTKIIVE